MDLPQSEFPLLLKSLVRLKDWESEASALQGGARVKVRPWMSETKKERGLRGQIRAKSLSLHVDYSEQGDEAVFGCSECGMGGCAHVLLIFSNYFNAPVSELMGLLAARLGPAGTAPAAGGTEGRPVAVGAGLVAGGGFRAEVLRRLKRQLNAMERIYVEAVEGFYKRHADSRLLTANALEVFLGNKQLAAWELVELWPRPPEGDWEAWLYLSVFLKNRGVQVPEFLEAVTQNSDTAKLADDWERQQAIRMWEEGLEKMLGEAALESERARWEARLVMRPDAVHVQWLKGGAGEPGVQGDWQDAADCPFSDMAALLDAGRIECSDQTRILAEMFLMCGGVSGMISYGRVDAREGLARLLTHPMLEERVIAASGQPLCRSTRRLHWKLSPEGDSRPGDLGANYLLELVFEDGERPPAPLFSAGGSVNLFFTADTVFRTAPLLKVDPAVPLRIPAAGLLSGRAMQFLAGLGVPLPSELADHVWALEPEVRLRCRLEERGGEERLFVRASACVRAPEGDSEAEQHHPEGGEQVYTQQGWMVSRALPRRKDRVLVLNDQRMKHVPRLLKEIGTARFRVEDESWDRLIGRRFPEEFSAWMQELPAGVHVDLEGDLASLKDAVVSGSLQLEALEAAPDWFDLHVALTLSDTELTKEEIRLLLEARGKFVRLKDKGWRKLEFELDEEQEDQLSELGINPLDLGGPPQRYHALQLAASAASHLIEQQVREGILRRATELQTSVTPPVPEAVHAALRAYQVEGFHFLSYLSSNRFGGILADDMGLGKTLQTLAWISWLKADPGFAGKTVLVVCPKSVVQNWVIEAERFVPGLRALIWRGGDAVALRKALKDTDLLVINYAQLRISAEVVTRVVWGAVVLDEAQYIKNPASQTATAACALQGAHRLALSGTPIENRLLDLWSIMHFAMPGLLGLRAHFNKNYDSRTDPLARRRLAARIRPFILRRTKGEVAKDLPERIEEDLVVEMEGTQAQLYRAELKRARQALLKIKSSRELDKERFNVLTSLLRLRQICCHPGLVSDEHGHTDSAKMEALVDLLEPLVERGQKVLVFSQFVEMLSRIEREIDARQWDSFLLTGETEDRGELVESFQKHEGGAVFLISLRAGGMGLNLTSASYVVLFDPWWNPAVENQAIDRTHRIGQTQQVIAYRLVASGSVEEKIRQLQRTKSAMAGDILGEETFAKALTLDDFQFLLEE
jgi:hypothetical protein